MKVKELQVQVEFDGLDSHGKEKYKVLARYDAKTNRILFTDEKGKLFFGVAGCEADGVHRLFKQMHEKASGDRPGGAFYEEYLNSHLRQQDARNQGMMVQPLGGVAATQPLQKIFKP